MTPEFSRSVRIDAIGSAPQRHALEALTLERGALAKRFDLVSLNTLKADVTLFAEGGHFRAQGTFSAALAQACVVSGMPVSSQIAGPFDIRFVAAQIGEGDDVELDADDCDEMTHDGHGIDLGEAVAQTLALMLDPFPRARDADAYLQASGLVDTGPTGPFAALKGLKGQLESK
ncbi:MAG: hypothetical protein RIS52_1362 [Pseudomonadota bacterium]|jgi:uncharacterized metal-binding protein YceD (DUF177 family)